MQKVAEQAPSARTIRETLHDAGLGEGGDGGDQSVEILATVLFRHGNQQTIGQFWIDAPQVEAGDQALSFEPLTELCGAASCDACSK